MLAEPGRCVPDQTPVLGANGYEAEGVLDGGFGVGYWIGHQRSVREWIVNPGYSDDEAIRHQAAIGD